MGVLPLKTVCLNLGELGEAFYCNSSRVRLLIILRWVQRLHPRILLCVSLEAEPGPGCTLVSWLLLPCLCVPSLPWLADVWICPLGVKEGHGGWICPLQIQNRRHRKASIPRSPHRVYLVSGFLGNCQYSRYLFPFLCIPNWYNHKQTFNKASVGNKI